MTRVTIFILLKERKEGRKEKKKKKKKTKGRALLGREPWQTNNKQR